MTLDTDTFIEPSCATTPVTTTTDSDSTVSTDDTSPTSPTSPAEGDDGDDAFDFTGGESSTGARGSGDDRSDLPNTGVPIGILLAAAAVMITVGSVSLFVCRRAP